MKANQLNYTPKGVTQNWDTIYQRGTIKKGRKGGEFVSRNEQIRARQLRSIPRNETVVREEVPSEKFTLKAEKGGVAVTRVNGKFCGKQVYSESLAKKLGLS